MKHGSVVMLIAVIGISACTDDPTDGQGQLATIEGGKPAASSPGEYSRNDFALCPALDQYREELGLLVGIAQNEEPVQGATGRLSCLLRGVDRGSWLKVEVMPAFLNPDQLKPEGFDAPSIRIPELGVHGWYISDEYLRRVIFTMGPLILQVEAESEPRPSQANMITVSQRVQEILTQAN